MPTAVAKRRQTSREGIRRASIVAGSLASRPVSRAVSEPREAPAASPLGAIVLALSVPLLFLHVDFQPGVSVGVGSTSVSIEASDLAVLAVLLAAALAARREGLGPL